LAAERERIQAQAGGQLEIPIQKSKEALADVLAALITRTDAVHILNLPNRGQINNLPREVTVETLAVIGAQPEARGLAVGDLPLGVLNTLLPHVVAQELTVEAALKGDRTLALQALLTDPFTVRNYLDAGPMLDELLAANAQYLPHFFA
jgi:alpha-galactosidase